MYYCKNVSLLKSIIMTQSLSQ